MPFELLYLDFQVAQTILYQVVEINVLMNEHVAALESHPSHKIAKKQTSGWGGMLAFYLKGGLKESTALISKLKIFSLAESLGGYESLIEVP